MVRVRQLRGAADNALSSAISRNADVDGWWAWGMLARHLIEHRLAGVRLDLHESRIGSTMVPDVLAAVVRDRVAQQMLTLGSDFAALSRAVIEIAISRGAPSDDCTLRVTLELRSGSANAVRERILQVWPHDPMRERRSSRGSSETKPG